MKILLLAFMLTTTMAMAETVHWTDANSDQGITTHNLYWWVDGTSNETVKAIPMPTMQYQLSVADGIVKGETYCFAVTALNLNGESARSDEVCQAIYLEVPNAPIDIVVD